MTFILGAVAGACIVLALIGLKTVLTSGTYRQGYKDALFENAVAETEILKWRQAKE